MKPTKIKIDNLQFADTNEPYHEYQLAVKNYIEAHRSSQQGPNTSSSHHNSSNGQ